MQHRSLLTLFFCLTCLVSSVLHASSVPDSVTQLVAETKLLIDTVDIDEFRKALDSKAYDLIIDVREADEYAGGYVPGAINIPRGMIEFKIWPHVGFPDNTRLDMKIYLYCKTGSRCALATKSLKDLGFTRVIAVDMQIADWVAAGHPLTFP